MITPAVTPRANTWAPTESQMDQDRVTGTSKTVGGKIEEGVGRMTGNAQTQLEGSAKQVAGAAEDLYGQAKVRCGKLYRHCTKNHRAAAVYSGRCCTGHRLAIGQDAPADLTRRDRGPLSRQ